MNIVLEKSSNVNAKLIVSITEADYKPEVDKTLKDYRKRANIKGFRPGMVPAELVKKMYGKAILVDEINKLLGNKVQEYIRDNSLKTVGDPLPIREDQYLIDWDNQKDFDFGYEIGLAGDFTIDFTALPAVKSYIITASEKELDETIERIINSYGEQIHPDSVEDGDMIFGTFAQGEWTSKSAIPMKSIKDEAKATFIGVAKDATVTFDVDTTFIDEKSKELATDRKGDSPLTGEVSFLVEDITRQGKAEMNQELFDKILGEGKVTTEEDFRKEVLTIISNNYNREASYLAKIDAEKMLLENVKIELPEDFLRRWLIEINEGKFTPEQIDADFDNVRRDVSWNLIKTEIASKHDIKVDYPEVLAAAKSSFAQQFGAYGDLNDPQFDGLLDKLATNHLTDKEKGQENFMATFNLVYGEKISDVIINSVTIETKEIDADEFKEIAKG
jgi:trigger factor